ncbi:preprotein translocase subunit SecE [Roseburia sp. MUC/MUC-530-WT-4D]|uniref:Protein translocase subunit SecE n=1 Tax=Roseburia porci TaxID=2605790 RepID=A0A6L5YN55_9FIRM|nr:preprotein translocase subunit SecE [Roseburia porci]MDD6742192.1 preprotein translocase subunit SecE [Roseburia porci]MST73830.1 preprotein translocase subunit SecE [Roseburia porci]
MGETEKVEKAPKQSWFTGLKAEFKKIIWPEQKSLVRQTVAVVAVSVIVGLIIALMDTLIQYGVNFLVGFTL